MGRQIKIKKSKQKLHVESLIGPPNPRWSELPAHWTPYLKEVQVACDEFFPQTYEELEEGIRCDLHPNRELSLWVDLSRTLQEVLERFQVTTPKTRLVVFTALVGYISGWDTLDIVKRYASSPPEVLKEYTAEMFKETFSIYKAQEPQPILFTDLDFQNYIGSPEDLKYI